MTVGKTRAMPGSPKDASTHTTTANAARELGFDPDDFARASCWARGAAPTGGDRRSVRSGVGLHVLCVDRAGRAEPADGQRQLSGARPSSTTSTDCSRSTTALWQARGTTSPTSRSSPATPVGWIIDPLTVESTARACLALADEHLGARPVYRGDLHPLPHRSLRRRARCDLAGRRRRRSPCRRRRRHDEARVIETAALALPPSRWLPARRPRRLRRLDSGRRGGAAPPPTSAS